MATKIKVILFLIFTTGASVWAKAYPVDSVGSEKKDGKTFVLHQVEGGQTLYAVMRKYKTTIQALKAANPGLGDNLATGQRLLVPYAGKSTAAKPKETVAKIEPPKVDAPKPAPTAEPVVKPALRGIYKVEEGQNLYRVAIQNGVSMADIRRWNGLLQDGLTAGQELIVSEVAFKESGRSKADLAVAPKTDSAKIALAEPIKTKEVPKKAAEKSQPKPTEEETDAPPRPAKVSVSGKRMVESGVAEVIDANDNSNKYLALHRSASVGTLLQVRNVSTGVGIWVKVIGKLAEIGANDRILIKLSARAQEKLSPGNRRFMVEVNYLAE